MHSDLRKSPYHLTDEEKDDDLRTARGIIGCFIFFVLIVAVLFIKIIIFN